MSHLITPAQAVAALAPEFLDSLTPVELAAFLFDSEVWLRPEQRVPRGRWRSFGVLGGRGWGKTFALAVEVNRRVLAGECKAPALMAPNEDRIIDVQVANLIATAPAWAKPELYQGTVRWPNGVVAEAFTPMRPGRSRSGNFDCTWLTEIVDWNEATREEAYKTLATATRVGAAQILWDTTSKGRNEVIAALVSAAERDPARHILIRGTAFDNCLLSRDYVRELCALYVEGTQEYDEEILGMSFNEASGALWKDEWISANRVEVEPVDAEVKLVALDPALSDHHDSDETGLIVALRRPGRQGQIVLTQDLSGRMRPERWSELVVELCATGGCSGVVVERNHAGDMPTHILRVECERRGLTLRELRDDRPFPRRTQGVVYVREYVASKSKQVRATAPAGLYKVGRVKHLGVLPKLEREFTTWVPGQKSPNRLDAACYAVTELAGLRREGPPPAHIEAAKALQDRIAAPGRARPLAGVRKRLGL